jgi:hypothetical protein
MHRSRDSWLRVQGGLPPAWAQLLDGLTFVAEPQQDAGRSLEQHRRQK